MSIHRYLAYLLVTASVGISGCTPHTDPLADWRGISTFDTAPAPEAIRQDAQAYFRTMPDFERGITKWDTGAITYWEDGTGQHAVVLSAPQNGERWHYALIYDRNNRRTKVLKYSVGGYMS